MENSLKKYLRYIKKNRKQIIKGGSQSDDDSNKELLINIVDNCSKCLNWINNDSIKTWSGIHVDSNYDLIGMNLSNYNFYGKLTEKLFHFKKLKHLNISNNNLNDTISGKIKSLTELNTLDLSDNLIYGTIPKELKYLTKLTKLYLSDNQLSGNIPIEIT